MAPGAPSISMGTSTTPVTAAPISTSYTIKSAKFNSSSNTNIPSSTVFTPEATYYNPAKPDSFPKPYDYVLISPASLKALASTPRVLLTAGAVLPGHTLVLVDAAYSVGLHDMLAQRFPDNPVCAIATTANVRLAPPTMTQLTGHKDDTLSTATTPFSPPLLLLHTGDNTNTLISPLPERFAGDAGFVRRQTALVRALNASGVSASVRTDYDQEQWRLALPFVALQPLAVFLEASTPAALLSDVLAKPLYTGIAAEIAAIARRHADVTLPQDYLATALAQFSAQSQQLQATQPNQKAMFTMSASSSSSSSSSLTYAVGTGPAHADAPVLFYNFFHGLPVPVDTLLLQLILLADESSVRTPYIESAFAYLSRLLACNEGKSAVLGRISLAKQSTVEGSGFSVAASLPNSAAVEGQLSHSLKTERRELDKRRRELEEYENFLAQKEQKLNQLSVTLKKQQYHIQQQQQLPQQTQMAPSSRSSSFVRSRPSSMSQSLAAGAPIMENPAEPPIDMMYLTSRRSRRSISSASVNGPNGRMRQSSSAASLTTLNNTPGLSSFANGPAPNTFADREQMLGEAESITSPHMTPTGTFSFANGGTGGVRSRYGMVDSTELSRTSRTNSFSSTRSGIAAGRRQQPHSSPALFTEHFGGPAGTYGNNASSNPTVNSNVGVNGNAGMFSGFSGFSSGDNPDGSTTAGAVSEPSRKNSGAGYYQQPPPQVRQPQQQERENNSIKESGETDYDFQNPYLSPMYQ